MKILVVGGSGKIGSAVAWDLARDPEVREVGIAGRNRKALERVRRWIDSERVTVHVGDVRDRQAMTGMMRDFDAGAIALHDRRSSYAAVERAIEAGLSVVDMLEEYHRRPDRYETEGIELPRGLSLDEYGDRLHERAVRNGVTLLDGMGFAPGLSNITLGQGMRELDEAEAAIARVGGNPTKAAAGRHPLRYVITWTFAHVLREYVVRTQIVRHGEIVEVEAGCDREVFRFNQLGRDELLECAVTPGMPSFIYTRPQLLEFAEKTIRWPGHWQGVQTLKECGLLGLEPVQLGGARVVPRDLLAALLAPRMRPAPDETDVCVMYNTLIGKKDGRRVRTEYFMWDEADTVNGLSAMQRTTGFPVAIAARMLARGRIREKGIVAPEDGIWGALYLDFMEQLERRGIVVQRVMQADPPAERAERQVAPAVASGPAGS